MMPSTLSKRNAILAFLLWIAAAVSGCEDRLDVELFLRPPTTPDPFQGVTRLRISADLDRGVQSLGVYRWDQGPLRLPVVSNPDVRRLVVEGIDDTGRVISSGATPPLDFLGAPPDRAIPIDFTRVGVLSSWPEPGTVRVGGAAVLLGPGRWMAIGGVDGDGCPREDTEVFGPLRADVRPGPSLVGGRTGDFSALLVSDAQILVVGGTMYERCGTTAPWRPARLVLGEPTAAMGPPLEWPAGAATAALSETLILAAGGAGPVTARTEVFGLDPRTFNNRVIGSLSIPRAWATMIRLDVRRALIMGGLAQTSSASAVVDASVFEPSRGSTLDARIPLGGPLIGAPALRTAAGSVVVLTSDPGSDRTEVNAVVVKQERDIPLGDVSPVTVVTSTEAGRLVPMGDGSLLRLTERQLDWIQLLPRQVRSLEIEAGPLFGGPMTDGGVLLFDVEGRRYTFNPGPGAVLGWRGPDGALSATERPRDGLGLVPLRPGRWRLTRDGLEGEQLLDGVELGEWAIAVDRQWGDFTLQVDVRAPTGGRALVIWGATAERFTFAEVGSSIRIGRLGASAPVCPFAGGPAGGVDGWSSRLQVRREGRRVTIEAGTETLECVFDATTGWLGLGVGRGTITFREVRVGLP